MTVSSTTSRVTYATDGSSTAFPVSFYFLANADLVVLLVDADGNSETLVLTTDYTVSGAGNESGGTVTLLSAPASGETLVIYRDPTLTQLTDYAPNDPFPAETHERALDKLTMICQRLSDRLARTFGLADSDTSGASVTVPSPAPGRSLKWSDDGLSLVNSLIDPDDTGSYAEAAAGSAVAAAAAAADAAAIYDNFDDRYLGAKSSDPVTDNDGNALLNGALYWNTAMSKLRIYNGSSWQDTATASPASFTSDMFSGNGSQTAFSLTTSPASSASIFVFVSGVAQRPTTDYSVSGTTLTFVAAPPAGTNNVLAFVASSVSVGVPDNGSVSTPKIKDDAVTYDKLQNISATKRVLGRNSSGAGNAEEVSLSQLLDWIGSSAEGDILYRGASDWQRLPKGSNGQVLSLASGVPAWATISSVPTVLTTPSNLAGGSGQTLAHGLGRAPYNLCFSLVFQSAINGYNVGDEIVRWIDGLSGVADTAIMLAFDSNNFYVLANGTSVAYISRATGNNVSSALSTFRLRLRYM